MLLLFPSAAPPVPPGGGPTWSTTITGVDQTHQIMMARPPTITMPLNSRAMSRFSCKPGYSPNRFQEVIHYAQDGITALYGGLIIARDFSGVLPSIAPA